MATKVKLIADGVITPDQITLTTASTGTNTTAPATTAFVQQEISALVDSSPDALNTLNELAAALGDDANFSTTVTNSIATKLPLAGGTMTGTIAGFTSTGIDDNATGTAILIESDRNVGINTASLTSTSGYGTLSLNGTTGGQLAFQTGETGKQFIYSTSTDLNILNSAAGNLIFSTNNLERARITSAGDVGIGTTDPSAKLDIQVSNANGAYGASVVNLNVENTNTSVTEGGWLTVSGYMGNTANSGQYSMGGISGGKQTTAADGDYGGYLSLWTTSGGANGEANSGMYERMKIDSSGRVGIGTTNPNAECLTLYNSTGASRKTLLQLDRPNTPGLQSSLDFTVTNLMVGRIQHEYQASNYNHMGFWLRSPGAANYKVAELRNGNGSSTTQGGLYVYNEGGGGTGGTHGYGHEIRLQDLSHNGTTNHSIALSGNLPGYTNGSYNCLKVEGLNDLHFAAGGVYTGYIGATTGFTDISDEREKENIVTITNATAKLKQLRGVYHTWKDTAVRGTDTQIGLIAQEVEAVVPEVVSTSNPTSLNTSESDIAGLKGVAYAKLVPLLIETIKELEARITTLEG